MAQAGWPIGGWPKIPWHQFIIPLKKRKRSLDESGTSAMDAGGHAFHGGKMYHALNQSPSQSPGMNMGSGRLSRCASIVTAISLLFIVLVAYYLPVILRRHSHSIQSVCHQEKNIIQNQKLRRWYKLRAYIATISLVTGMVVALLDFHALTAVKQDARNAGSGTGTSLMPLNVLWAVVIVLGFFCSARAVNSLWADWRRVAGSDGDCDCEGLESGERP